MDIFEILEGVNDEKSFILFSKTLLSERLEDIVLEKENPSNPYSSSHLGWQNTTIENFLESSIAWAEDSSFGKIHGNDNLWNKLAQFLLAGKIYE